MTGPKRISDTLERHRDELLRYVRRLVVRPEVAEEIVQGAAVRALTATTVPGDSEMRPWLFRIATNLALDELRRHGTWRETALVDARAVAERDPAFVRASQSLRGTPEVAAIAKEHLAFCFSCTLRNLDGRQAAALLLKEVYAFSVNEIASVFNATPIQIKNWLQAARRIIEDRYAATCALVNKRGVCYQCVELSEFFTGRGDNPLDTSRSEIVRQMDERGLGPWHRMLLRVFDEISQ